METDLSLVPKARGAAASASVAGMAAPFVTGILVGQAPIRACSTQIRGITAGLFMPVFSGAAGLHSDLTIPGDPRLVLLLKAMVIIASVGKVAGAFTGGWLGGLSSRESVAKLISSEPGIEPAQMHQRLQSLGWNEGAIDYHSLQIAIACLEAETRIKKTISIRPIGGLEKGSAISMKILCNEQGLWHATVQQ